MKIKSLPLLFLLLLLQSCGLTNSEGRVYIDSSNYKYQSMSSQSPKEIANAIEKNRESKIILVACPTSTPFMIIPLQELLSINSRLSIYLVRDDCLQ